MERNYPKRLAERYRERGGNSLLRYHQGSHLGQRLSPRRDTMSLDSRDGRRTLHHPGGESCGRGEDALHEQRRRRVQGRDRLHHQDFRPGGPVGILQGFRSEFLAPGFLEYRTLGDVRANEVAGEEVTWHRVKIFLFADYSSRVGVKNQPGCKDPICNIALLHRNSHFL